MSIRTARKGIAGVAVAALLGGASVAYACTVAPQVSYSLNPESTTPGQTVTVEGKFVGSEAPVEIRWNGAQGKVLATATPTNNAFSVPVRIPEVPAGIYSLMLVTADSGVGRTSIEVTGSPDVAPERAPTRLWPTSSDVPAPASGGGSAAVGVGMLAVGLVALSVASGVLVTRRRRVLAGPPE